MPGTQQVLAKWQYTDDWGQRETQTLWPGHVLVKGKGENAAPDWNGAWGLGTVGVPQKCRNKQTSLHCCEELTIIPFQSMKNPHEDREAQRGEPSSVM